MFKNNSLAAALAFTTVFSVLALQGCSSDEQATPGTAGKSSTGGSGGKPSTTAGNGGTSANNEGGAAGQDKNGEGGSGNETSNGGEGGEGGAPPVVPCDLSFDNSELTAITDNGGVLPDLP
jgi:hypothetical protein